MAEKHTTENTPAQKAAVGAPPCPDAYQDRGPVTGYGLVTGCDLGDLTALWLPPCAAPLRRRIPPLSREALLLPVELAQMTYTLQLEPWLAAGWQDVSIQIDNTLHTDVAGSEHTQTARPLTASTRYRRALSALNTRNPLAQLMGALRQRDASDTVKAVCMMHPLSEGRYLLAIGFMGTGKRFYDWFSNLRFTTEEGFHKGFFQLCRHFERADEEIVFPETARALGLNKLTLRDVLAQMRSPDSRFRLWMAGHSQGGALMQVYAHRLITQSGVLRRNMAGYGFASPTVATAALRADPAAYPLWHILNQDDLVPRMGAQVHLGVCMTFFPDDDWRQRVYRFSPNPSDQEARRVLLPHLNRIAGMPELLLTVYALAECILEEKGEDSLNTLLDKRWHIPAIDRFIAYAGGKAYGGFRLFLGHLRSAYLDLCGYDMPPFRLSALKDQLRPAVRQTPLRRILAVLLECFTQPHNILDSAPQDASPRGAYADIANWQWRRLVPFLWQSRGGWAVRRYAHPVRVRHPARLIRCSGPHRTSSGLLPAPRQTLRAGRPDLRTRRALALGRQRVGLGMRRR